MVSTRRGIANTGAASNGATKAKTAESKSDTIHVLKVNNTADPLPTTPKLSSAAPHTAITGNISEHDLSLTSPFTDEIPGVNIQNTPRENDACILPERTLSSALRRLAPKPFGNMSGSSHNPIVVTEDSPPRPTRAPKRKHRHRRLPEPHQFMGKGYKDVYSYHASRSALEPLPASGSTFTGHQSHDIYRMMNAKLTAAPGWNPNAAWGRNTQNVPFEVQYPFSAQFLAQPRKRTTQATYVSPYASHYEHQSPKTLYRMAPVVSPLSENALRKKAVQYIREHTRPSPRKRRLSDSDPDETSASESEQGKFAARVSKATTGSSAVSLSGAIRSHQNNKTVFYSDNDPNFNINHLVEHTSLITSLLQAYPYSTDQKGLREEISMLVSVQNQHVMNWMKSESQSSRKRRKSSSDGAVSLGNDVEQVAIAAARHQKQQDSALRQVFSANADIWQDGTGDGVADVFAVARSSSLVAGLEDTDSNLHYKMPEVDGQAVIIGHKTTSTEDQVLSTKEGTFDPLADTASDPRELQSEHVPANLSPGPVTKSVEVSRESSTPDDKPAIPNRKPAINDSTPYPEAAYSNKTNEPNNPTNKLPTPPTVRSPTHRSKTPSPSPTKAIRPANNSPTTNAVGLSSELSRQDFGSADVPALKRQDTTSSMEKVDVEYRELTARYLVTNGLARQGA